MTTRETFRRMRTAFVLEGGDDETLRELVDQVTAPTYGIVATRPTLLARGGRRITTPRDLAMDVAYLIATAARKPAGLEAVFRDRTLEELIPLCPFLAENSWTLPASHQGAR